MTAAPELPTLPRMGETTQAKAEVDDDIMWSVTTVLSVLDKPALIPWAVGETAERTVHNLHIVQRRLEEEGAEEAIDYIKGLRWKTDGLLKASDLGTVAHHLFNRYALEGARPEITPDLHPDHASKSADLDDRDIVTLRRMLDQFDRFLQEWQPDYHATEVVVYHPDYGYAGQTDGFAGMGGEFLIIDYKTSRDTYTKAGKLRGPYPEAGLQLAGYRYATAAAVWRARRYENRSRRYYLLSSAEKAAALPVPEADGGAVIYVTPERYGVYPARCGPAQWESFLYCLEVARWSFNEAIHVVGNPMTPPHPISAPADSPFAGLPDHDKD